MAQLALAAALLSLQAITALSLATPTALNRARFARFSGDVRNWQQRLIGRAKTVDPAARWTVDEHAKGTAVIVEDGEVWEKGCISVTLIENGALTAARAGAISARVGDPSVVEGALYSACALSFVLHALSPLVPTLRGDVRCFAVGGGDGAVRSWFGGGLDLTPSFVEPDDCAHFHGALKALCERVSCDAGTYHEMKKTCDEYFYLPARQEHRGVGGVFFDDLDEPWAPALAEALMETALADDGCYLPLVARWRNAQFTHAQKRWQLLRRGRYIEFNLLYDRGVKFGLSAESVERVLVSSPPLVAFRYKAVPLPGSPEAETLDVLRNPREWA